MSWIYVQRRQTLVSIWQALNWIMKVTNPVSGMRKSKHAECNFAYGVKKKFFRVHCVAVNLDFSPSGKRAILLSRFEFLLLYRRWPVYSIICVQSFINFVSGGASISVRWLIYRWLNFYQPGGRGGGNVRGGGKNYTTCYKLVKLIVAHTHTHTHYTQCLACPAWGYVFSVSAIRCVDKGSGRQQKACD